MSLSKRESFNAFRLFAPNDAAITEKTGIKAPGPKRVRDKTKPTEWHEQSAVIEWWDWYAPSIGIDYRLLFAIPNGAYLGKDPKQRQITMMFLKRAGLRPGVLDLFLAVSRNNYHGAFIEMKSVEGRESDDQAAFGERVRERGYFTAVCYGAEAAMAEIKGYLG